MNSQSTAETSSTNRTWWKFHKRTWLIVFCLVVVPWVLIGVPGEFRGGGGTTGMSVGHTEHGWPFVHLDGTQISIWGHWVDDKFVKGIKPGFDSKRFAKEQSDSWKKSNDAFKPLRFDSRLQFKMNLRAANKFASEGYWTSTDRWPYWKDKGYYELQPWGLICNLLVLGLLCFMVGMIVERIVRKPGRKLRFSLMSLGIGFILVSLLTAYCAQSYFDREEEFAAMSRLELLRSSIRIQHFEVEERARLPKLVSELLNHGLLLFRFSHWLGEIQSGHMGIDLTCVDANQLKRIVETADECPFPLTFEIDAYSYNRQVEDSLATLDSCRVTRLFLDYDVYEWVEAISDSKHDGESWSKQVELAGIELNFDAKLKHLEVLTVSLSGDLSQREQLRPFCNLPLLKSVDIAGLNAEGVKFLLETFDQWPADALFDFEYLDEDEISEELIRKLEDKFPKMYPMGPVLRSLVPVVG